MTAQAGKKTEEQKIDGRLNRSVKTKAAIAAAFLEMVDEGVLSPTSEEVAKRAGVGHRTVFRHFEDMESLYVMIHEEIHRVVWPLIQEIPVSVPLDERIKMLVQQRMKVYKRISPFRKALFARYWNSPALQRMVKDDEKLSRSLLLGILPEAKALPKSGLETLDLLLSFDAWLRMRELQQLSETQTRNVLTDAVSGVLLPGGKGKSR